METYHGVRFMAATVLAIWSVLLPSGLAAQTSDRLNAIGIFPVVRLTAPDSLSLSIAQQPAGPPPTPRHTGIKALTKHLVTNFKYLPSKENLLWAGAGGGIALAAHPFDDDVNEVLVGNERAQDI